MKEILVVRTRKTPYVENPPLHGQQDDEGTNTKSCRGAKQKTHTTAQHLQQRGGGGSIARKVQDEKNLQSCVAV